MGSKERENFDRERDDMMKKEAQRISDTFRPKIEREREETFETFEVTEFHGDLARRILAKIRVTEDSFLHLSAKRKGVKDVWEAYFTMHKGKEDSLLDIYEESDPEAWDTL